MSGSVGSGSLGDGASCIRKAGGQRPGLRSRDMVMAEVSATLLKIETNEKIKRQ